MERAGRTPAPGTIIGGDGEWLHVCAEIQEARKRLSLATSERATNAAHDALVEATNLALSLIAVQIRDAIDANAPALCVDVDRKVEPVKRASKRGKASHVKVSLDRGLPRVAAPCASGAPAITVEAPAVTVEAPARRVRFVTL
jgi:hypothetical protein